MNLLKPTFCEIIRNKKLWLYIVIVTVIVNMLIMIVYSKNTIDISYKDNIENSLKNRVVIVTSSKRDIDLNVIKEMKHIKEARYAVTPTVVYINSNALNMATTNLLDNKEIIIGNQINNDNLEVILPNKMMEEYKIGSMINAKLENIDIKVKVVGNYKDDLNTKRVYVSNKVIDEITEDKPILLNQKQCLVEMDEYKNVKNFISDIESKGYSANIYDTSRLNDIKTYGNISIVLNIIICIIILSIYIMLSVIMSNIIEDEKIDIALLKTVGYKNRIINLIIFCRILTITLISYVLRSKY